MTPSASPTPPEPAEVAYMAREIYRLRGCLAYVRSELQDNAHPMELEDEVSRMLDGWEP